MNIGERIKIRREELDMSQDTLAKAVGYKSRSTINKIELGVNELKQKKILEIARALDVSPAYLMGWEKENPPAISGEGKLDVTGLNSENVQKAKDYIDLLLNSQRNS